MNESINEKCLVPLFDLFKRQRPYTLQELTIADCNVSTQTAYDLFKALRGDSNLSKLTFSKSAVFRNEHTIYGQKAFDVLI